MKAYQRWMFSALLAAGAGSAQAADKVTFQLDWLPAGDKSPVYAGVKQGYFAAEDIDVTIQAGRGSSDSITKIGTGSADIGIGGISALMMAAAEGGAPVKAVMSVYTKQPDALFTTVESGITSLKALEGKTVATATFSSSNTIWPVMLQANGVDPDKIKLLKVDPSAMAAMLAQGKVDATINWVTTSPGFDSILKQTGKKLYILPWAAYGLDGYGMSVFASDKMIAQRPEVLRRFLRAYRKSVDYAVQNPDGAAQALKAVVPEIDTERAAAEFRASIPSIQNEVTTANGAGVFEPRLLKATWVWVAKSMTYKDNAVDPEKLVDRRFLPAK